MSQNGEEGLDSALAAVDDSSRLGIPGGEEERVRDRANARREATNIHKELELLRTSKRGDQDELAWGIARAERALERLLQHRLLAPTPEPSSHFETLEGSIFMAKRLLSRLEDQELSRLVPPTTPTPLPRASLTPAPPVRIRQQPALPTFDGAGWLSFWGLFEASVDSQADLADSEKMAYLLPLLRGGAAQAVAGFQPTGANYSAVVDLLRHRFYRPERREGELLHRLLALKPFPETSSPSALRGRTDELFAIIRELETHGVSANDCSPTVKPTLEPKMPSAWRMRWARKKSDHPNLRLHDLLTFIEKEMDFLEEAFCPPVTSKEPPRPDRSSRQTLTGTTTRAWTCPACNGGMHGLRTCPEFLKLSPAKRSEKVKEAGVCFQCLGPHRIAECRSHPCRTCGYPHHSLLCFKTGEQKAAANASTATVTASTSTATAAKGTRVHQQSAVVQAHGIGGRVIQARLLFDSGSDTTYIRQGLADALALPVARRARFTCVGFQGRAGEPQVYSAVNLGVSSRFQGPREDLEAWVVPTLCAPLPTRSIPRHPALQELQLADDFTAGDVDILVGSDVMNRLMLWRQIPLSPELRAVETVFGFVIHGPTREQKCHTPPTSTSSLRVTRLWEQDLLGLVAEDEPTHPTPKWIAEEGRYEMPLLWINDARPVSNRRPAKVRTDRMTLRLDNEALAFYDTYLQDKEAEGVIEKSPAPTIQHEFFLPHRCVQTSSKLRPVFDGSAKDGVGRPLNEYLDTGPSLLSDLYIVLVRFRTGAAALQADIQGAFHQVGIPEADRPFLQFWWGDAALRYRRVPFGISCAPYMLMATVRHHLSAYPDAVEFISSIYMDDLVVPFEDSRTAARHLERLQVIFRDAGMTLHKSRITGDTSEPAKILGLLWDTASDRVTVSIPSCEPPRTKRSLLSTVAKVFDPLGLLAPWIIRGKLLFQASWKLGVSWDEELPEEFLNSIGEWWSVDRPDGISTCRSGGTVGPDARLYVFCDASPIAYCAAVYLFNPPSTLHLLTSKARVAPVSTTLTVPRMELLGATMGALLARTVASALKLSMERVQFFTDSADVLFWIRGQKLHKPFVENRLRVIRADVDPLQWRHVPGIMNPADLGTRGVPLAQLQGNSLWWTGPNLEELEAAPSLVPSPSEQAIVEERRILPASVSLTAAVVSDSDVHESDPIDLTRFSSWTTAVRVTAYVLRFVSCLRARLPGEQRPRGEPPTGPLSFEECKQAELELVRRSQLSHLSLPEASRRFYALRPFQSADQIIRIQPRTLEDAVILVPPRSELARLIVLHYHSQTFHLGTASTSALLSSKYHLPRGEVRRLLQSCRRCRRFRGLPFRGPEGDLPSFRREFLHPFTVTGIDFFGPICVQGAKRYVLLFTCSSTRAVHLELVQSCGAAHTALALRRFFSLRGGPPHTIMSDNAPTFRQLSGELTGLCTWSFIPEASPWWGGFWERLVGLVKRALRITLHGQKLNIAQFTTVLYEVTHFINLRPLTPDSDGCALTPAHFLYGVGPTRLANPKPTVDADLTRAWEHRLQVSLHLEKRFYREYLTTLRNWRRPNKGQPVRIPEVGEVVLVEEDGPRHRWPIAMVTELIVGRDGSPRAAFVRLRNITTRRPLQRLYALEASPRTRCP